ncbi:MAG: metalloregulator ArsR/SmtB family transcription factor [Pseudomonadota bacterium]
MVNYSSNLDAVFRALADPTRRAVVHRLTTGPASVKELARPFEMGLPAFLKHIAVLEDSRLLTTHKVGRVRTCALVPERLIGANHWFEDQISLWEGRTERLASFVESQQTKETR